MIHPHLLQPALPVFIMQLYWLSIVFIGWTIVRALLKATKEEFVSGWLDLPLAAKFLIVTATGFMLFGIFTVIGYAFRMPPWWLGISYAIGLLFALMYIGVNFSGIRNSIIPTAKAWLTSWRTLGIFSPFSLMLALAGVDLLYNFFIGSFIGYDGFIHVSKIRHLAGSGFTLTDAYYGTVPETRHTISVLHTLMAIPAYLGINPITSWYASAMFLKLMTLCAIFYLAWRLLYWVKRNHRMQYASLVVILSLALFNNYYNSYPNTFVATWIILLTATLFDMVIGRNLLLVLMACALIALTHPIDSLATAVLVALIFAAFFLFNRQVLYRKNLWGFAAAFVLLLSTPLFVATLPNRMTENAKDYQINQLAFFHIGSHEAFMPGIANYFTADGFTFLPWPITLLSITGIIGLLFLTKSRNNRILIGTIILYVPLVLYNPIAFGVIDKVLPIWGLARFNVVDQLTLLFAFFGLLTLFLAINRTVKAGAARFIVPVLTLISLIIFIFTQSFGAVDSTQNRHVSMYHQQEVTYGDLSDISQVLPNDKNAIVLAERNSDSFMIPVVAQLRVVAINEYNSTPAADMTHRLICSDLLYTNLQSSLMKQANVSYVLTQRQDIEFYQRALRNPQLVAIKNNDRWVLFKFVGVGVRSAHNSACIFHES